MEPKVPLELQQIIINFALDADPSRARQLDRLAFRSVNRDWRDSIKTWRDVEVFSVAQLARLNVTLGDAALVGDAALDVRSLHLVVYGCARASTELVTLFGLTKKVESIVIQMDEDEEEAPPAVLGLDFGGLQIVLGF